MKPIQLTLGLLLLLVAVFAGRLPAEEDSPGARSDEHFRAGVLHYKAGDAGAALLEWEKACALAREAADRRRLALVVGSLGDACEALDRHEDAMLRYREAIEMADAVENPRFELDLLARAAALEARLGRPEEALRLLQRQVEFAPSSRLARLTVSPITV